MAHKIHIVRVDGELADLLGSAYLDELSIRMARKVNVMVGIQVFGPSQNHHRAVFLSHDENDEVRELI